MNINNYLIYKKIPKIDPKNRGKVPKKKKPMKKKSFFRIKTVNKKDGNEKKGLNKRDESLEEIFAPSTPIKTTNRDSNVIVDNLFKPNSEENTFSLFDPKKKNFSKQESIESMVSNASSSSVNSNDSNGRKRNAMVMPEPIRVKSPKKLKNSRTVSKEKIFRKTRKVAPASPKTPKNRIIRKPATPKGGRKRKIKGKVPKITFSPGTPKQSPVKREARGEREWKEKKFAKKNPAKGGKKESPMEGEQKFEKPEKKIFSEEEKKKKIEKKKKNEETVDTASPTLREDEMKRGKRFMLERSGLSASIPNEINKYESLLDDSETPRGFHELERDPSINFDDIKEIRRREEEQRKKHENRESEEMRRKFSEIDHIAELVEREERMEQNHEEDKHTFEKVKSFKKYELEKKFSFSAENLKSFHTEDKAKLLKKINYKFSRRKIDIQMQKYEEKKKLSSEEKAKKRELEKQRKKLDRKIEADSDMASLASEISGKSRLRERLNLRRLVVAAGKRIKVYAKKLWNEYKYQQDDIILAFNVAILGFFLYNCLTVPYRIAFESYTIIYLKILDILLDLLFYLFVLNDIVVNLVVGKIDKMKNTIEVAKKVNKVGPAIRASLEKKNLKEIPKKFRSSLKSFFKFFQYFSSFRFLLLFFTIFVPIDWFVNITYLRLNRLLVIFYVAKLLTPIENKLELYFDIIYFRIVKMSLFMMFLIHFFACLWFWIARNLPSQYNNFIVPDTLHQPLLYQVLIAPTELKPNEYAYSWTKLKQYFGSLYFGSYYIVGFAAPFPQDTNQAVYSVFSVVFGAGFFATLIGSTSSIIMNLGKTEQEFKDKINNIKNFMKIKHVDKKIQKNINKYYNTLEQSGKFAVSQASGESDVFSDLDIALKRKVNLSLHKILVKKLLNNDRISIFQKCQEITGGLFMEDVCNNLKYILLLKNFTIVRYGEAGKTMYFIESGKVKVVSKEGKDVAELSKGNFFGEIALFLNKKRTATIVSVEKCELYELHQDALQKILQIHQNCKELFAEEARLRYNKLKEIKREERKKKKEARRKRRRDFSRKHSDLSSITSRGSVISATASEKPSGTGVSSTTTSPSHKMRTSPKFKPPASVVSSMESLASLRDSKIDSPKKVSNLSLSTGTGTNSLSPINSRNSSNRSSFSSDYSSDDSREGEKKEMVSVTKVETLSHSREKPPKVRKVIEKPRVKNEKDVEEEDLNVSRESTKKDMTKTL